MTFLKLKLLYQGITASGTVDKISHACVCNLFVPVTVVTSLPPYRVCCIDATLIVNKI